MIRNVQIVANEFYFFWLILVILSGMLMLQISYAAFLSFYFVIAFFCVYKIIKSCVNRRKNSEASK
jgi:hypothetical protein